MGDTSGILLSYVRRGLCDPFFFFFGMRCAQYKVHALCSFAALAPHMPCMLPVLLGERSEPAPHICDFNIYIYIYIYNYTYVGVCVTPFFFFLRRALCTVQSSCTVLVRCARPTHALHAPSRIVMSGPVEPVGPARPKF